MHFVIVDLSISADEYLKYYQQPMVKVIARSHDGRVVHLPANILQAEVKHDGVRGRFKISFSEAGKFLSIERLTG